MNVGDLRGSVVGDVVAPGDEGWDAARAYHSGIGRPELVVRARTVGDVQAAVRYAAAGGLSVGVRGGGHSAWGALPGGVVVDLSTLADVQVDAPAVHVGGGATWGKVARTLATRGLGLSSGDTASVGVGGLTLGGGIGWMVRAWGLAADQLIGVQLVTASGDLVEVDAHSQPELFWALRGGGGNFGVVTRFDFRAHELSSVVWTVLQLSGDARPVLATMRDVMANAPRDLTVTFMDVPAMDPSAPAGATLSALWIGDDEGAARAVLAPLVELDGVTVLESGVRAYPEILLDMPAADPSQPVPGFIGDNILAAALDDDLIEAVVSFHEAHPASVLFLRSLGGAFGDVAQEATAFPARRATWFVMEGAFDIPGVLTDDERVAAESGWARIAQSGLALYGNFTATTDQTLLARMYPPATLSRLSAVKHLWDPQNVFSRNFNIRPV
ncbi:FAD-binding oxidoreductase [Microbacterium rhizomatis]|uniref:FAD-binding oxidoreductase n=1 Tax=Microbacterium rhizomatis TaxID=1631477 RepID=A0A5J5J129_9MICO|nr:FAD-binding oxidoreductase [Microbacterium rhizomatis]KAA9105649.1 FAD-binding oxidoreductase [Microbacterium rhizomatis]